MFLSKRVLNNSHKALTQANRIYMRSNTLTATQAAYFSEETQPAEKAEEAAAPTQAEIEKGREEWGIKYDDECLKFEKEWQVISDAVEKEQMVYLESELSDL